LAVIARRSEPIPSFGVEASFNIFPQQGLGPWLGIRGDDGGEDFVGHIRYVRTPL